MARKPRIHVSGGFYHVILRGNARQDLFLNHADRDIWQAIVRRVFSEKLLVPAISFPVVPKKL
jgi:REP element-mobilizing transposase RayT